MLKKGLLIFTLAMASLATANGTKDVWEPTEAIWNFTIISKCDVGLKQSPFQYFRSQQYFDEGVYQNIQSGDIVWLPCKHVPQFSNKILPQVKHPFVLVITDGDESFPSDCTGIDVEKFIGNDKIIHIFAQNCDYQGTSGKVSHLPIGMDFHSIAYKGGYWGEVGAPHEQEKQLQKILQGLQPTHLRKLGAFVDFQLHDTTHAQFSRYLKYGEDRASIFKRVVTTGLIDFGDKMKRSDLWKKKGQYAFSISPHGNGLDCHRTWEDLALGCIVIVKTSLLDPLYEGLPVVIVKDWSEINRENMKLWLSRYGNAFTNPDFRIKLTNAYWLHKINSAALPYKTKVPSTH